MVRLILGIAMVLFSNVVLLSAQGTASADTASRPKVILVELFTSEGCSSCPPADNLLRAINGTQPSAGQIIVGISEHVTYWNSLGWSDPFSSDLYTDRQNRYGSRFGLDSVYTPQMVVNGTEQFVGSDQSSLASAIRKEQNRTDPVDLRILSANRLGGALMVDFSAKGDASLQGSEIFAVLTDDADQSIVPRGENSGRTLSHVAVARTLLRVAKLQEAPQQTVQIALPTSFHGMTGHHLILFAQAPGSGKVLGADSKPL
ncbi:DUF1223 domain-containing protein [Granulicella mallensis]|uniref:DUF1223 domain-containing protein n=1 Tax=Granulicella mallensis (strain ATCC BAA-1857 / DSM 23137 / MP5ACTX8) TaxID=682795 RepID=G8NQ38_GRAMM|nr:DUF1223 domain-containing protein [Granulicella mallensis]AEU38372.1 protein of unknown function DUF1223 [Granulicella mallensis MP5ACTX8]